MGSDVAVDANALREEVRSKYREVAINPHGTYHFHTGRTLARRLGYRDDLAGSLPDVAVESFAGVANPFSLRSIATGEPAAWDRRTAFSEGFGRSVLLRRSGHWSLCVATR